MPRRPYTGGRVYPDDEPAPQRRADDLAPPRRGPAPPYLRTKLAQLRIPIVDELPEHVRIAYRVLHRHGAPGASLSPTQREWVKHARTVIDTWEARRGTRRESSDA